MEPLKSSMPTNNRGQQTQIRLPFDGEIFSAGKTKLHNQTNSQVPLGPDELLRQIRPEIDKSLYRHLGTAPDALTRARAKQLVLDAYPRYDPEKASIGTFIDRQLQPIVRWQQRRQAVLKMPDRQRQLAARVGTARVELEHEYGREPSPRELADYLGLPEKNVLRAQRLDQRAFAASTSIGETDDTMITMADQAVADPQAANRFWIKFIRDDLSSVDQMILNHTLGVDGAEILSNKDLAKRLKLSPGAISQRKARIQRILDAEDLLNPVG